MKQLRPLAAAIGAMMLMGASAGAYAIDTNIQFNTTGAGTGLDGSYDITGINEFDWQSSGDLVIESAITLYQCIANCANADPTDDVLGAAQSTTLAAYFGGGTAALGDVVVFDIHAHARLNDMIGSGGGSVAPATLDTDGAATGDDGFEITAVLDASESAKVTSIIGGTTITFFAISGTTTWFYDDTPDSDVDAGTGFDDGIEILIASLFGAAGTFQAGVGGSTLLSMAVTNYDINYIQTDPASNQPLSGATFDTLISLVSSLEASATDVGDNIGSGYTVATGDVGFKADANSEFSANPVPEPGTLFLLGAGLLGLGRLARRKSI